jgi:Zn-dependent protease
MCPGCSVILPSAALSCPSCHQLVHAQELEALSRQAKLAEGGGGLADAHAAWTKALTLLPPETVQYRAIAARLTDLDKRLHPAPAQPDDAASHSPWAKRFAQFGPLGIFLWKFKLVALFVATKAKFLLLGLTKLSTFTTMLASFGLYWTWYGWKFALGFVVSIYIHEMGHIASLRRFGIAATAPMFIPGFGALVLLKERPGTVAQDARVGLAGPIWGLGAAIAAALIGALTGSPLCYAVARVGAWINLFNLIPVWQLDGGRGFRALTRRQRAIALAAIVSMWVVTTESMLLLLSLGAGYRLFTKDAPAEPDRGVLFQYTALVVLLSLLFLLAGSGAVMPQAK